MPHAGHDALCSILLTLTVGSTATRLAVTLEADDSSCDTRLSKRDAYSLHKQVNPIQMVADHPHLNFTQSAEKPSFGANTQYLPPIDEAQAEAYLIADLYIALDATLRYWPVRATESERRLAPVIDFTFNPGAGRLQMWPVRRRINQRNWPSAVKELRW